jgi:hypothetical protein
MGLMWQLQDALVGRLAAWPALAGCWVRAERRGEPALRGGCGPAGLGGGELVVYLPALLVNTAADAPGGQVLDAVVLVSVGCLWRGPWRADPARPGCAMDLAEAALLCLHRWRHGVGGDHLLLAERQAAEPCPAPASPLEFASRFARGGEERFRRHVSPLAGPDLSGYLVHFSTSLSVEPDRAI